MSGYELLKYRNREHLESYERLINIPKITRKISHKKSNFPNLELAKNRSKVRI